MRFFKRKPMDPKLKAAYDKAYGAEMTKLANQKQQARIAAVQAKARGAAARASVSGGSRALGGLISAGKSINKRLDKMDMDKFEAYVTGKPKRRR